MSIRINVGGMNYNGLTCAQRAEIDNKRKNRLTQVRQQCKGIAQHVREKVQCEKENQLKRLQAIKQRELDAWKKRTQCEIQQQYGQCLSNLGAAHIAACETSCEEGEAKYQKRQEYDLMAAQRGRSAMLQEQRKRDREAEDRLAKRKRNQLKNAGVQTGSVSHREFGTNVNTLDASEEEVSEGEEPVIRVETFKNKRNFHKNSATQYNPAEYACNSVDSSNNCDSEEQESSEGIEESELEFDQITNLLKQKCYGGFKQRGNERIPEEVVEISESSEEEEVQRSRVRERTKTVVQRKGILKKSVSPKKKPKAKTPAKRTQPAKLAQPEAGRVKYVDFGNKYTTTYVPDDDLVTVNHPTTRPNARTEASIQQQMVKLPSENVLRELAEIRAQEALKKEKTRRDYERLRLELDEVSKQEKEAKEAAGKALRNITASQLEKHEQARKVKMNKAVENTLKRNIITCPPVDSNAKKSIKSKSCEVNVAPPETRPSSSTSSEEQIKLVVKETKKTASDLDNLVKIERLRDLLERINHQKQLLLREIEKSEDIPGPDLEKVIKCLEKLEKEKSALNVQQVEDAGKKKSEEESKKKSEELQAREQKLREREKRLENGIRELYKTQQTKSETSSGQSESVASSDVAVPPVEIIIKVQSKSPRSVKVRKTIRCLDTLTREPSKIYPRTPKKVKKSESSVEQQTQTSPPNSEILKPILKKPEQANAATSMTRPPKSHKSDDSSQSISTTYQSLPERINLSSQPGGTEASRKPHHKLNPALLHYIKRLIGMQKNQLSVSASTVTTPGSSTINTSGNRESPSEAQGPTFDNNRLDRLQDFINDNYSFLSEISQTLERSQIEDENDWEHVEGVWRDILNKKKVSPRKSDPQKSVTSKQSQGKCVQTKQQKTKEIFKKPIVPTRPPTLPQRPQTASSHATRNSHPTYSVPSRQSSNVQQVPTRPDHLRPQTAVPARPQITKKDMMNVTEYLESHMLNNFTEYSANCNKRISELAEMMNKVRQEKMKLIENSLSSGEFGHFTEYREIAVPRTQDPQTTSASDLKESPSQREDPASEEINNILQKQTRPFGVSKDSGISILSRPVTSSDFRDSPDARVTSEERENLFQPIIKDIPKPPKVKLTSADGGSAETIKDMSSLIREQEEKAQRKLRPPLSLNRFSPLEKPHEAHELSTIAEVETPSASKVNLLDKVDENVGRIEPFPSFSEYAMKISSDISKTGETSFLTLGRMKKALEELKLKSFAAPTDYGIEDLTQENDTDSEASDNFLSRDIEEEMRRRKLIKGPFVFAEVESTPPTDTQTVEQPRSPRRKPAQSRLNLKTPEKNETQDEIKTPTKKRPFVEPPPQPETSGSNDTLSGIQEIEKEPKGYWKEVGMEWADSMNKRVAESKQLESSSSCSSTSIEKRKSIEMQIVVNQSSGDRSSSSSEPAVGKPLDLKLFLVRELTKKSIASNNNSLSDESSLSSQFMRSLLKDISSRTNSSSKSDPISDKIRTSTPVQTRANTTGMRSGFTGDSLSTLKASEGDASEKSDQSNGKEQRNSN